MTDRVAIVDCSISNLTSVKTAFEFLGASVTIARDPQELANATHVVLPGVGAFPRGIQNLVSTGFDVEIRRQVEKGKPIIGLCLGMQLLAERGEEFETVSGLGLIPGAVTKLPVEAEGLRLPHIGWNDVSFRRPSILTRGLRPSESFYFLHSFGYDDSTSPFVLGTCDYGGPLVAAVERDNVFGAQFHPEKSQKAGLTLLRNFLRAC